jgi:hypothetical protein
MLFYIIENMNQNYNKIPCFTKENPKLKKNFVVYQNRVRGFLLQVPIAPLTLPQNFASLNSSFIFQNSPFLDCPKSHHRDYNERELKIQTNKVP